MRSHLPRSSLISRPVLLGALAFAALAGVAGCGEAASPAPAADAVDAAEQSRIDASRKKIDDGSRAVDEKRYAEARKLLAEAEKLGIESHRFEIDEVREKLDKREAKLWSNEVAERFEQKACAEAFAELSKQMDERQSPMFTQEVRKLIQAPAVACASARLDELTAEGKFAEARSFLAAEPSRAALGDAAWKKLSAELEGTITEALAGQMDEELKAKRWAAAADKVDAATKKGDATESIARSLVERIRAAAAPELTAEAARGVGARDAAATLKQVDAAIARLGWQAFTPDLAGIAKEQALPEELGRKRGALAAWVESQRVKMKPLKKPEKRWAHGVVPVAPAASAEGESRRDLRPSSEVWVLGQTKDLALVTEADPGAAPLSAALEQVVGWVPVRRLAAEPTADWVPPDDQLKGQRVWAPLREKQGEKQATLELGVVSEIKGGDIFVQRLADDVVVKVNRKQLRNGRLDKGTKVLALCQAENDPATIFDLIPGGKIARVVCEGGVQKEQPLASLRSRPELLPPSK